MNFLRNFFEKIDKFWGVHILKRTYRRTGKCLGCGQCCTHIYVRHTKDVLKSEEEFKKLRWKHPFYSYLEIIGKDETGLIFKCKNRDDESKLCKIHRKRPFICRKYPQEEIFSLGGTLAEGCGYSFVPYRSFAEIFKQVQKSKTQKVTRFE